MQSKKSSISMKMVALGVLILFTAAGCASNGGLSTMTDTTKGGILGGAGGAAIGAIIDHANPWAGALIGAAGGALTGAVVGHFMDDRKKNLEKALAPQINGGAVSVQILKDNALLVTQTGATAFAPGSAVVNSGFIPTLQTIANVAQNLRQNDDRCDRSSRQHRHGIRAADACQPAGRGDPGHAAGDGGFAHTGDGFRQSQQPVYGRPGGGGDPSVDLRLRRLSDSPGHLLQMIFLNLRGIERKSNEY